MVLVPDENFVGRFEWYWCPFTCFKRYCNVWLMLFSPPTCHFFNSLHGPGVQSRVLSRLPSVFPFGVVWGLDGGPVASNFFISTPEFFFWWVCQTTTQYKQRYLTMIPTHELVVAIRPETVSEQLYSQAFTGCDIVSPFRRKGKKEHGKPATFVIRFLRSILARTKHHSANMTSKPS